MDQATALPARAASTGRPDGAGTCGHAQQTRKLCATVNRRGSNALNTLSITITTRNRWDALRTTLERLARTHPHIAIVVVDDGSDTPCPFDPVQLHPRLEFHVRATSAGLIVRRNQLLQSATTPYVLSLDDDSYLADGDLPRAVQVLERDAHAFCASLPIFNPTLGAYQNRPRYGAPSQCRAFVGCAHIMKRAAFVDLGGYRELLVHQGEEQELAARAYLRGWHALHVPDCLVHHLESAEGRSFSKMDYYGARNAVLWNDWFVPDDSQLQFRLRRACATLAHVLQNGRLGQLRGHRAAVAERDDLTHLRERMSNAQFERWRALPFS